MEMMDEFLLTAPQATQDFCLNVRDGLASAAAASDVLCAMLGKVGQPEQIAAQLAEITREFLVVEAECRILYHLIETGQADYAMKLASRG